MGKIYMVRHGETQWNTEGRIQGQTNIPLSEVGKNQARLAADRLATVTFDAVYSSDLDRTLETAKIITESTNLKIITNPSLRERFFGIFEGLTIKEREDTYPELFAQSTKNDVNFAPPEGESIKETSTRMSTAVQTYKEKHMNDSILIVGHGGSLRCAISSLLDLPLESSFKFVLSNCGVTIFETYEDNTVLLSYNDTHHLQGVENKEGY